MPQFNASSALLFKRFVEAGVTSPEELANVMGNASVETGSFTTMNEQRGYRSVERVVSAVRSAGERNTREEIQAAIDSRDPEQMAHILYDNRSDLRNTQPGEIDEQQGRAPGPMTQNFAGALTAAATAAGLTRVDHVVLNDDASRAWAVQGGLKSPFKQYTEVNVMQAIQTPLAQSSNEAAVNVQNNALRQSQAQQQQSQQHEHALRAAGQSMGR